MKTKLKLIAISHLLFAICLSASAQGTAFTYQGRLNDGANPANGIYDLRFAIYDSSSVGTQLGGTLTNSAMTVSNGLFTVTLDFGGGIFTGADRWLDIAVRTNGAGAFAGLTPRQPLTPSPYAIMAGDVAGDNIARLNVPNTSVQATGVPTVSFGYVVNATVTGGGSGYVAPPSVTVNDSTGSGAAISATVSNGVVTGLSVVSTGSGYSQNATLTIGTPPPNNFQVFVSSNYFSGVNTLANPSNSFIGTFSGNGAGVSNVNAATLNGLAPASFWNTAGNSGTTPGANFLGTMDNKAVEIRVNGQRVLRLEGTNQPGASDSYVFTPNILGGFSGNFIAPGIVGATISGGGTIDTNIVNVGGPIITNVVYLSNSIAANFGIIGGGLGNHIQSGGKESVIAGGRQNVINGQDSFVGGGGANQIADAASFDSAVVGGDGNVIQNASESFIGGGSGNNINGPQGAAIAGGFNNSIQQPGSLVATIAGGYNNKIQSAEGAAIAGGESNTITNSQDAAIAGGNQNFVSGNYSFAAGRNCFVSHQGCFMWSDGTLSFGSTGNNRFMALATGGFYFYTGSGVGVQVAAGGNSWSAISDRNVKENFAPVDCKAILEKVTAMPITTWNLKTQPPEIRHLGPMAQDFKAAFQIGEDDRHISGSDADGVALAAIQGLNRKLEEQRAENAELKQRLEALEQIILKQKSN